MTTATTTNRRAPRGPWARYPRRPAHRRRGRARKPLARRGRVGGGGASRRWPEGAAEAEVQHAVSVSAELGVPVVARGAGDRTLRWCERHGRLRRRRPDAMDRILDVDPGEPAGRRGARRRQRPAAGGVAEDGLWYPPDPASAPWSTIGGNVATNAGGVCCVKYGVTGDYVLGLRGRHRPGDASLRLGRQDRQGCRRLRPHRAHGRLRGHPRHRHRGHRAPAAGPRPRAHRRRFLRTLVAAGDARSRSPGPGPHAVRPRAARPALPRGGQRLEEPRDRGRRGRHPPGPDRHAGAPARPTRGAAGVLRPAGAIWAAQSTDDREADALFAARRLAYPAVERLGPVLTEDVCVPIVRCRRCSGSTRSPPATTCSSPTSPTPATATCTRC